MQINSDPASVFGPRRCRSQVLCLPVLEDANLIPKHFADNTFERGLPSRELLQQSPKVVEVLREALLYNTWVLTGSRFLQEIWHLSWNNGSHQSDCQANAWQLYLSNSIYPGGEKAGFTQHEGQEG